MVYGREKDRDEIVHLLLSVERTHNELPVISIIGMGGVGKTTLAQLVYNDADVANHFDRRVWVHVSEEFNVVKLTRAIIESATGDPCYLRELAPLQAKLYKLLMGKKFLLVLDDVWVENYIAWDSLKIPAGVQGSKILVTTRNEIVASKATRSAHAYKLNILSDDHCWSLFRRHAFRDETLASSNLELIGKEIVKKCEGLPLAAKALGSLLFGETEEKKWNDILYSEIWKLPNDPIIPALRLSYSHLPGNLKRCFSYCSIFPKGYEFDRENLILLWMAERLLEPEQGKELEDIGDEYFNHLLQAAFFQQSRFNKSTYVMHDLMNDLARFIAGETYLWLKDGSNAGNISRKARYCSYYRGQYEGLKKFNIFDKVGDLRTFLPLKQQYFQYEHEHLYLPKQVIHDLFTKLRCLRVLCLSYYYITELPDSISNLIHLRLLDLSYTPIRRLPESICSLHNLQTLLLDGCRELKWLPNNTGCLINLRHLKRNECQCFSGLVVPGICRLTNLRTLSSISLYLDRTSLGFISGIVRVSELEHLSLLRGNICISIDATVVESLHEAERLKHMQNSVMKDKQHLRGLELLWNCLEQSFTNLLIKLLEPHTNLQELTIKGYLGNSFPQWTGTFSHLSKLTLERCHRLTGNLPCFPNLVRLEIKDCGQLTSLGEVIPSDAHLLDVGQRDKKMAQPSSSSSRAFDEQHGLQELVICNCPKLTELPGFLDALTNLILYGCNRLITLPMLPLLGELDLAGPCNDANNLLTSVASINSLYSLRISRFSRLQHLPKGLLQGLVPLQDSEISDCDMLNALSDDLGFQHLSSLSRLEVKQCPELLSFPRNGLPSGLQFLRLSNCDKLEYLHQLGLLTNLRRLSIIHCNEIRFLPDDLYNLVSLHDLKIESCSNFMCFPKTGLPYKLERLEVKYCKAVSFLSTWLLCNQPSLKYLIIVGCDHLKSIPICGSKTSLKVIQIKYCQELKSLSDDFHNLAFLEHLEIEGCPCLRSLPQLEALPTTSTLRSVWISKCENLKCLPNYMHNLPSIQELRIWDCQKVVSFPEEGLPNNLRSLSIRFCGKLASLPNHLPELTCLQELEIWGCPKLASFPQDGLPSNLTMLSIKDCENIGLLVNLGLHRLTCLRNLTIAGFTDPSTSFESLQLPTTLSSLCLERCYKLISLRSWLPNLTFLEKLVIIRCPNVASLSKVELLNQLSYLEIQVCPLLERQCLKGNRKAWSKVAHIPYIKIDQEVI
ncbi:PREDICTED: putative disease resistance RPP13-like protein 1 [Nelumbo nucifera]|uniref:Disease resistance RPP13-like protein 1 n=1 Tax=Nelumbo nucifera TaxID=4432 RepID=A0A1U8Q874_NELNU|nr:PREDICTED: putative disease resistance RPP13-like protein 1 [Nelumbo nucifera]